MSTLLPKAGIESKLLTRDEARHICRLARDGMHQAAIARSVGRDRVAVRETLRRFGVSAVSPLNRFSDADIEKLKFMAEFGHDGKSIARALNRTPQSVRVKACEYGVSLRPPKMEYRRIKLSVRAWRALQIEADRIGTSAGRLARLIVETVAKDCLFGAVLDVPMPRPRPTVKPSAIPRPTFIPPQPLLFGSLAPTTIAGRT
jgi:hypothetical protein